MKNLFNNIRLILLSLMYTSSAFTQTGPGGVGDNTSNVLWLDAHTMGGANGSTISSWTDYSGNSSNAIQSNISFQPTVSTGSLNGRNAINFDGTQNLICGANAAFNNLNVINWYVLGQFDDINTLSIPFNVDYGSLQADDAFTGFLTQNGAIDAYGRFGSSLVRANYIPTTSLSLFQGVYSVSGTNLDAYKNFSFEDFQSQTNRATSINESVWIGGKDNGYKVDGKISEVFVFNHELDATQTVIVKNYVSAKFGTSIGVDDHYSFEGTYGLGVIGIGQENVATAHTDSQGNGYFRINNPSDLQDNEYLFIGHEDISLTSINLSTNVPDVLPSPSSRYQRQWRAEKTGDLGNITLVFDLDPSIDFSADPDNYVLLIDGDSDMSGTIDHVIAGTYNSIDETVTFTNVNLQTGDYFTIAGDSPLEIISIQSGNWNIEDTWDCNCIPTSFNDVIVDIGHNVTIDDASFVNNLYVESGGKLSCTSENEISIYGDAEIGGDLILNAGKITMSGSFDQSFDGLGGAHTLHDFEINNSSGATITLVPATYTLEGKLSMTKGILEIDNTSGGTLILNSTSATTGGRIGALTTGTSIIGNVSVRRSVASGNSDWRNLSSPVVGATFLQWDPDLAMSGAGFPDGCAYDGQTGCFYSVRYTDHGISSNVVNASDPITNTRGYEVYCGTDLNNFDGTILTNTGTVNTVTGITQNLQTGWATIGNPYACPITYNTITKTSQISNYYYVYDAASGDYQWYDGSSLTSSVPEITGEGLIAIGQGIWIYATSAGSLTFNQSDKSDDDATFFKSNSSITTEVLFTLSESKSTYYTVIGLEESINGLDNFDSLVDIMHLQTGNEKSPSMAFQLDTNLIRKNYISNDMREKSFDLYTSFKNDGYYTLGASNIQNLNHYQKVLLYDRLTNEFLDFKKGNKYSFYAEQGESNRFKLILTNTDKISPQALSIESETDNNLNIVQMGNIIDLQSQNITSENVEISLINMLGQQEVYTTSTSIVNGSNIVNLPADLNGIHIFVVNVNGKQYTKKLVF